MFVPVALLAAVVPLQLLYLGLRSLVRRAPVGVSMTLLRMSRNPLQYTWMMLLLVMLTGLGVLSTTVGATLGISQEEQILYDLAADIHVTRVAPPAHMGNAEYKSHLLAIPEVTQVALGHRTLGEIGETTSRTLFPFLAIETESFPEIAWFREDFADQSLVGVDEQTENKRSARARDDSGGGIGNRRVGQARAPVPFHLRDDVIGGQQRDSRDAEPGRHGWRGVAAADDRTAA